MSEDKTSELVTAVRDLSTVVDALWRFYKLGAGGGYAPTINALDPVMSRVKLALEGLG